MIQMVTKEQRRGARADLYNLREFVIEKGGAVVSKGIIALKFDWAHAKLHSMVRQCAEAFDDIEEVMGALLWIGPYPAEEEEEPLDDNLD